MKYQHRGISVLCLLIAGWAIPCFPQSGTATYDTYVQQGNAQLKAGSADLALAAGKSAVRTNPAGWQGYTLEGGALMSLKRYEEAADAFSKAIDRAPESKQPALRELRRRCLQTAAGPAVVIAQPTVPTTQGEIVLWKSIESSSNPADFQSYLDQNPQGAFAVLARRHLQEIADNEAAAKRKVTTAQEALAAEKNSAKQRHSQILADLREAVAMKANKWKGCSQYSCDTVKGAIEVTNLADCEISLHILRPGGEWQMVTIPLTNITAFSPSDGSGRSGYETLIDATDGQSRMRVRTDEYTSLLNNEVLEYGPNNPEKASRVAQLFNDASLGCTP